MKPFFFVPFVLLMAFSIFSADLLPKHWHESKGFGTNTKGGIAGEVYKVTNLKSSGPGSLADAVSKGNRLVVFEVGGIIEGGLKIGSSNITIAGQTAPSPGISFHRGNVTASGKDIVLSHITVRLGTEASGYPDAANITGSNTVFDHVAIFWGKDETLSLHGVNNVTLYKCIIGESLQFTGHEDGEHSKGSLINNKVSKLCMIGTLFAHNAMRNPRVDGGEIFLGNHVVYNWGTGWDHVGPKVKSEKDLLNCPKCFDRVVHIGADCNATMVNSVAIQGPDSKAEHFLAVTHSSKGKAYVDENIIIDPKGKPLTVVDKSRISILSSPPIWPADHKPMPTDEAFYETLRTAGSRPGNRDAHYTQLIKTIVDRNGDIPDSQEEVGGYPTHAPTARPISSIPDGEAARQAWLDELEDQIAVDRNINLSPLYGMVGTKESDKLHGPTAAKKFAGQKTNDAGITIVQKHSGYKQLLTAFTLSTATSVKMEVFDLAGNVVVDQPQKMYQTGSHEMLINVQHLPVGLYICRLQIGNVTQNISYNCY